MCVLWLSLLVERKEEEEILALWNQNRGKQRHVPPSCNTTVPQVGLVTTSAASWSLSPLLSTISPSVALQRACSHPTPAQVWSATSPRLNTHAGCWAGRRLVTGSGSRCGFNPLRYPSALAQLDAAHSPVTAVTAPCGAAIRHDHQVSDIQVVRLLDTELD